LRKVADEMAEYKSLSASQLGKRLKTLEQKMFQHARDLEFEEAAKVRDEIQRMQELGLGVPEGALS
jgi:excinuclease ABC subunit B